MTQTPQGNAYRLQLPPGTTITLPDDATAAQIRAIAINEIEPLSANLNLNSQLKLRVALQLVSPAYIADRNETERRYATRIAQLEEQLRAATTK